MMTKINEGLKQICSDVAKILVHKMAEIENEEVASPVWHLVERVV